jgi:myo-inositol-1(or 4)-monophosphatase
VTDAPDADGLDAEALLAAAVAAAHAGGDVVRRAFGGAAGSVTEKGPGDWVSEVDTQSEQAIRRALAAATPDIPVLGEEGGGGSPSRQWVVDPLDGTANFLHGLPVVGVSIALVEDGTPVVAVVHAPMLGDTYTARTGGGAHHDGIPMWVSRRPVEAAICATGFPFRKKRERLDEYRPVFDRALLAFEDLRRAGAASLDLAWTAAGVFDGYFEQALGPWDMAAGALLVREAGGVVSDWTADERAWFASGDIVAGPPDIHARLLELIRG